MCGVLILNEHTCSSVVLRVKTVISNFEYVKYSSLLNTLKGICFDDGQYVSWSCHSGFDLGLGLKNLVLFTSLVENYKQHRPKTCDTFSTVTGLRCSITRLVFATTTRCTVWRQKTWSATRPRRRSSIRPATRGAIFVAVCHSAVYRTDVHYYRAAPALIPLSLKAVPFNRHQQQSYFRTSSYWTRRRRRYCSA